MALNALELVEDLQARSDLSPKDASAVVFTITRAIGAATSELVTRDQLDARIAELRADFAELKSDTHSQIASVRSEVRDLRAEMHQALRTQTVWIAGLLVGAIGVAVAILRLFP